jgi:hypothetical protein
LPGFEQSSTKRKMSGKFALIIGNTEYTDPGLAQLTAPGRDVEDFARVLKDQDLCAFDEVAILANQLSSLGTEAIDVFFDQRKPDDLLVLYFSGHGVRDESGALYLAFRNTLRSRLRSTAIKSEYIRVVMDESRSKRQVLILDCCNSGAFAEGMKAETGGLMGMAKAFEGKGYGHIVLTASDSIQFAWEGDKIIGETDNSLFTHFLIEGLEGEADLDGDGRITVDELYDYAYEQISSVTPKQTPTKSASKQEGEIVLRQNIPVDDIKPVLLPAPLLDSIENPWPEIRLGAVRELTKLSMGKNLGLTRSVKDALKKIAAEDDSRQVQRAAEQALESIRQQERAKREAARRARHESLRQAVQSDAGQNINRETKADVKPKLAPATPRLKPVAILGVFLLAVIAGGYVLTRFLPLLSEPTPTQTIAATLTSTTPSTMPGLTTTTELVPTVTPSDTILPSPTNSTNKIFTTPEVPTVPPTRIPLTATLISTATPTYTLTFTPTFTLAPTTPPPTTSDPCGPLPTRVAVGMTIQVTTSGQVAKLGIRPQPTLASSKIFELLPGDPMTVLNGPVCSDNSYFWYINSQKGEGWVREGNGVFYFVDPVP